MDAASKNHAHIQFISPQSSEGKEIHNVLSKKVAADEFYPLKPGVVVAKVQEASGLAFTINDHTKAWKLFKMRPKQATAQPENTDKRYCIYHPAHKDYTYSVEWVNRFVEEAMDVDRLAAIRASKL